MSKQSSSSTAPARRTWSPKDASITSLDAFLKKYKPSTTKASTAEPDDGWIWVHGTRDEQEKSKAEGNFEEAIAEGTKWLTELAAKCKAIDDDDNIPTRASKAKGASKKQRKEHAQREADLKNKLRQLGIDAKLNCGKWLFYRSGPALDGLFSSLAHSIIDGPLSKLKTPVPTIKAATVPENRSETSQEQKQVICVYFLDFWNPEAAKEVLECLLQEHGALPTSCKSDLYTYLGINSNHASGLRSTEYQPKELIPDPDQIEEYLAAYKDSKQTVKVRTAVRDVDEDGFEDDDEPKSKMSALPTKASSTSLATAKAVSPAETKSAKKAVPADKVEENDDESVTEDDDEEEAELRKAGKAKKAAEAAADATSSSSSAGVKRSAPTSSSAPAPKRKPAAPKREAF